MRFLFVDRILELEKGRFATGIKNVSFSDEYLLELVPNFPVLPRSLTVEAIAQLISWLIIFTKDFSVKPIAVTTDHTRFLGDVRPGDQMFIKAEIKSLHENEALCAGSIEIDGEIVTELYNGICAFIPIEELEDISTVKGMFYSLFKDRSLPKFLDDFRLNRQHHNKDHNLCNNNRLCLIDKILELQPGKRALGVKGITMSEDFIKDHFPRRHVMPGTMILESLVQLAEKLVSETMKEKTGSITKIVAKESRKIKFRQYVRPGDQMILEINLLDIQTDTAKVKAKATVQGNLAASAQMEFNIIYLS